MKKEHKRSSAKMISYKYIGGGTRALLDCFKEWDPGQRKSFFEVTLFEFVDRGGRFPERFPSVLNLSAEKGDLDAIKYIIKGCESNGIFEERDKQDILDKALRAAMITNEANPEMINYFVGEGLDINKNNRPPILTMVRSLEVMKCLVEECGANVNAVTVCSNIGIRFKKGEKKTVLGWHISQLSPESSEDFDYNEGWRSHCEFVRLHNIGKCQYGNDQGKYIAAAKARAGVELGMVEYLRDERGAYEAVEDCEAVARDNYKKYRQEYEQGGLGALDRYSKGLDSKQIKSFFEVVLFEFAEKGGAKFRKFPSVLNLSAAKGELDTIKYIIKGCESNGIFEEKREDKQDILDGALRAALRSNKATLEMIDYLVGEGLNINANNKPPILILANNLEVMRRLVENHDANENAVVDCYDIGSSFEERTRKTVLGWHMSQTPSEPSKEPDLDQELQRKIKAQNEIVEYLKYERRACEVQEDIADRIRVNKWYIDKDLNAEVTHGEHERGRLKAFNGYFSGRDPWQGGFLFDTLLLEPEPEPVERRGPGPKRSPSVLDLYAERGGFEAIKYIIAGCESNGIFEKRDKQDILDSALRAALRSNKATLEMIDYLVGEGLNINANNKPPILILANNLEVMRHLVEKHNANENAITFCSDLKDRFVIGEEKTVLGWHISRLLSGSLQDFDYDEGWESHCKDLRSHLGGGCKYGNDKKKYIAETQAKIGAQLEIVRYLQDERGAYGTVEDLSRGRGDQECLLKGTLKENARLKAENAALNARLGVSGKTVERLREENSISKEDLAKLRSEVLKLRNEVSLLKTGDPRTPAGAAGAAQAGSLQSPRADSQVFK